MWYYFETRNPKDFKRRCFTVKAIAKVLGLITQIGISMIVPIFLCVLVGAWLDRLFSSSPLFLIIFVILGVGASFRTLYMITKQFIN